MNGVKVYLLLASLGLFVPVLGVALGLFPAAALATLLAAPLVYLSGREGLRTYDTPRDFIGAVRFIVVGYIAGTTLFTAALVLNRWLA
ncbi:MAG: hypothetical protein FD126_1043 [Elusimicrobia bacterium]|nr:MAG: hypothetical protein FD126_1043 [Elusimicrobiota bacterium]